MVILFLCLLAPATSLKPPIGVGRSVDFSPSDTVSQNVYFPGQTFNDHERRTSSLRGYRDQPDNTGRIHTNNGRQSSSRTKSIPLLLDESKLRQWRRADTSHQSSMNSPFWGLPNAREEIQSRTDTGSLHKQDYIGTDQTARNLNESERDYVSRINIWDKMRGHNPFKPLSDLRRPQAQATALRFRGTDTSSFGCVRSRETERPANLKSGNFSPQSETISGSYRFVENSDGGITNGVNSENYQRNKFDAREYFPTFNSENDSDAISSGHYSDIPGANPEFYRRPGSLTLQNGNYRKQSQSALLSNKEINQKTPEPRLYDTNNHYNSFSEQNSRNSHGPSHVSYSESTLYGRLARVRNSAITAHRETVAHTLTKEKSARQLVDPQLLIKEEEHPNLEPLDSSPRHPYSLLYWHYLPK